MLWPTITSSSTGTRPAPDQRFEPAGESAPIDRSVKAAVVVEIDRRVAEIAGQGRAVVVPAAAPLQIVHAQAVRQHHHLAAGRRDAPPAGTWGSPADCRRPPGDPPARRSAPPPAPRAGATSSARRAARRAAPGERPRRPPPGGSPRGRRRRPGPRSHAAACRKAGDTREISWCTASTRSVTPRVASVAIRARPRRSENGRALILVMPAPRMAGV